MYILLVLYVDFQFCEVNSSLTLNVLNMFEKDVACF